MNNKIKNILKITIFSGIFLGTVVLLSGSEIKREETITLSNYEKNNASKDSVLTLEAVKLLGWDKKTNITLPEGLTTIHDNSLSNLPVLKKIVIPSTVTSIGLNSFSNTPSLMDITMSSSFQGDDTLKYGFTQAQWDAINWVYPTNLSTIITLEVLKAVGFDKKEVITSADWEKYLPNAEKLENDSFKNNSLLKSIQIPDTITSIGNNVFHGTANLKSVTFGANSKLVSLGKEVFFASGITDFIMPNTVTYMAQGVFHNTTGLITAKLSSKLTSINHNTFWNSGLKEFEIPENITSLGQNSFAMTKLEKIILGDQINSIPFNAFTSTTLLKDITMNIKFKTITPSYGFTQEQWDLIKWTYTPIADEILTQENIGLLNWGKKTTITLNDWKEMAPNVTTINGAFLGSTFLESIEIPATVIEVGVSAFQNASKLASVTFQTNSKLTTINNLAFSNTKIVSIAIPNLVTTINQGAFSLNKSLTTFVIPSTITVVAPNLLEGSSNIKEIIIPDSIITIGDNAFKDMTTIKKIIVPGSVQTIGANSFSGTTQLLDITMSYSFQGNNTLKYGFTQEQWDAIKWAHMATTAKILTLDIVKSIGWDKKISITLSDWKTMAPNVTKINSAFFNNIDLIYVEIPNSILNIELNSFKNTTALSKIIFEKQSRLEFIGNEVFSNSSLKSIEVPDSVISIGDSAFKDTKSLKNIKLSNKFKTNTDHFGFTDDQWNSIIWASNSLNAKFIAIVASLGFIMIIQSFIVIYSAVKIKNFDV